jgi:hypothetical protein
MPNRYEREIEEILRNMDQADPKAGKGQKLGGRFRKSPSRLRVHQPRSFSWNLSTSEWLLATAIILALLSGGIAYVARVSIVTLILALISFVCLVGVAVSQFMVRSRRPRSLQYGNVTITPLRRGPLSTLRTQWNLFMLKMRYRRKNGKSK